MSTFGISIISIFKHCCAISTTGKEKEEEEEEEVAKARFVNRLIK